MDILCQAKSGMGKTAVFVLATLQQLEITADNHVIVLVMCHTRELAFQISKEYERFSKYMPLVKVSLPFYLETKKYFINMLFCHSLWCKQSKNNLWTNYENCSSSVLFCGTQPKLMKNKKQSAVYTV